MLSRKYIQKVNRLMNQTDEHSPPMGPAIHPQPRDGLADQAFQVGVEFHAFYTNSHCYDARDLRRFFLIEHMPAWVRDAGELYDRILPNASSATLDAGIVAAKRALREQIKKIGTSR